ncbi:MAG TPA: 30S ribosomal protein S5, partial [Candidatus Nanoarchaeia archaeon]|nr:30S ribosomal protein S5 [Candidatus Nanoarchaeia archaeon]
TNLCLESECQKLLRLAGIKDIYSKSYGHTTTKLNMIKACFDALQKVAKAKLSDSYKKMTGTVDGRLV